MDLIERRQAEASNGHRLDICDIPFASSMEIHPTATISPHSKLGEGIRIGPYAVIEDATEIGDECEIATHAVIKRFTTARFAQPRL